MITGVAACIYSERHLYLMQSRCAERIPHKGVQGNVTWACAYLYSHTAALHKCTVPCHEASLSQLRPSSHKQAHGSWTVHHSSASVKSGRAHVHKTFIDV